jgi:hypothetical protein
MAVSGTGLALELPAATRTRGHPSGLLALTTRLSRDLPPGERGRTCRLSQHALGGRQAVREARGGLRGLAIWHLADATAFLPYPLAAPLNRGASRPWRALHAHASRRVFPSTRLASVVTRGGRRRSHRWVLLGAEVARA